ncbi:NAD(P)-dependent alcohol dehydrogenase [candidate division KSB1 bacterium]|nr:NAD(P)-dependent alcohol dehydrogenase [candidate division KSB1 bacterium]
MKAVVYTKYGAPDVLSVQDVKIPVPGANEVRIIVHATTVTAADSLMRTGKPLWGRIIIGLRKPKRPILGIELAGKIESIGKNVKRFKPGDDVYGFTGFGLGAHAEYVCMPESGSLVSKPVNMNYNEAAAIVDGATTTLFFLKDKAHIQSGQKVLIIGASGSIGTAAVQIAKYFGAEVTGVCSTTNLELVTSLGADHMIDYTREDFTNNGVSYDIIFDTVGKSSFAHCKNSLTKNGSYLPTVGLKNHLLSLWTAMRGGKRVRSGMSIEKIASLTLLKELIETGKVRPVIDKIYPLERIVEAHRYVDTGHKRGNVVISVVDNSMN